ncbi:hypothetical protein D1872_90150 [compost metagenome]
MNDAEGYFRANSAFFAQALAKYIASHALTPTEAAEKFGMKRNTIIAALIRGRFDEEFEKGTARKYTTDSGKNIYYLTEEAMIAVFGPKKEDEHGKTS